MKEEDIDQEPTEVVAKRPLSNEKPPTALSHVRRDMSDEELSSSGALKLLLDRLDRAENQNSALSTFRDRYYEADKKVGVLEEKLKSENRYEILYSASLALGAVFVGLASSSWTNQPYGWLSLLSGFALMIGALVSKGKKK